MVVAEAVLAVIEFILGLGLAILWGSKNSYSLAIDPSLYSPLLVIGIILFIVFGLALIIVGAAQKR